MDFTLFDSANLYNLSQPDLNFIDECIKELPENADYNALDICLGDETHNDPASGYSNAPNSDTPNIIQSCLDPCLTSIQNNPTLPKERSTNDVSIESHSDPDVDGSMEINHQGLLLL